MIRVTVAIPVQRAEVFRRDDVKNGSEQNANDGEQMNIAESSAAKDAGKGVRDEDEECYENVSRDMHRMRRLLSTTGSSHRNRIRR
jgi:hypothetical protein